MAISFFRGVFGTQNDAELMKKSTSPDVLHILHFSLLRLADNKLESYNIIQQNMMEGKIN